MARLFCIGNVLNHDVYLQTALVLGYAPWKLAVGLSVANLWTLIESLMEEWRQYYRCCLSLFDFDFPTIGDQTYSDFVDSIFGSDDGLGEISWRDSRGLRNLALTRPVFGCIVARALIWHCIQGAREGQSYGGVGGLRALNRVRMLAAVLGGMDQHGRRCLFAHGYITARLPWERFQFGRWWEICKYTLDDGRPGEQQQQQQHKAPRTLSIRVAQWITYSCNCEDWGLHSLAVAYRHLAQQVEKFVDKGKSSQRSSDS